MNFLEKVYDQYASAALNAMIQKIDLFDRDGGYTNEKISQEELNDLKMEIARSAHAYAFMMIESRAEFLDPLKQLISKGE